MKWKYPSLFTLCSIFIDDLAFAASESERSAPHYYDWHMHSHGFWWIFPLGMFLFFVFFFTRRHRDNWFGPWQHRYGPSHDIDSFQDSSKSDTKSALAILNERYARGEIDKVEYEEKKSTISQTSG